MNIRKVASRSPSFFRIVGSRNRIYRCSTSSASFTAATHMLPVVRTMKTTAEDFQRQILELRRNAGPSYGDNVLPAIRLYGSLECGEERRAYQDALEAMLSSTDSDVREYAVTLCLGFFVFKDTR
jgi:hypothetical protein